MTDITKKYAFKFENSWIDNELSIRRDEDICIKIICYLIAESQILIVAYQKGSILGVNHEIKENLKLLKRITYEMFNYKFDTQPTVQCTDIIGFNKLCDKMLDYLTSNRSHELKFQLVDDFIKRIEKFVTNFSSKYYMLPKEYKQCSDTNFKHTVDIAYDLVKDLVSKVKLEED